MKKTAFTLAEILIAAAVIGVISAVTVPAVMQNTNKQEYVTALKKTYSTLSQVTNQIIAEEGSPKCKDDTGSNAGWACSWNDTYEIFKKYLNQTKDCKSQKGCFEQINEEKRIKKLNGGGSENWNRDNYGNSIILADGTQILFTWWNFSDDCRGFGRGSTDFCVIIAADVNGVKLPNAFGRDVFLFALKENGLYPAGCDYEDCTAETEGYGCACKVLKEGAINY